MIYKGRLFLSRKQVLTLASLAIVVPAGFCTEFYTGPAAHWVNDYLGGVFYVIFWCLLFFLLTNAKPLTIAFSILLATCCLEVLQLWHPPFLTVLRARFLGEMILGHTFSWADFPYYFLGCGIALFWMKRLGRKGEIF